MKTGYYAHHIRGAAGKDATPEEMEINVESGIAGCNILRRLLPEYNIYCPGEHEELFRVGYQNGSITSKDILKQCCSIVSLVDILFVGDNPNQSNGMQAEMKIAVYCGVQIIELWRCGRDKWPEMIDEIGELCL